MNERSPGEVWYEIVRTAELVRGYHRPDDLEGRLALREPLTEADTQYLVGIVSDSLILAELVDELAQRKGPLADMAYRELDIVRVTGIPEIDLALMTDNPAAALRSYFKTRATYDGHEAVARDLELALNTVPTSSPAHAQLNEWLERVRSGQPLE